LTTSKNNESREAAERRFLAWFKGFEDAPSGVLAARPPAPTANGRTVAQHLLAPMLGSAADADRLEHLARLADKLLAADQASHRVTRRRAVKMG
jgi:hypothetical protein